MTPYFIGELDNFSNFQKPTLIKSHHSSYLPWKHQPFPDPNESFLRNFLDFSPPTTLRLQAYGPSTCCLWSSSVLRWGFPPYIFMNCHRVLQNVVLPRSCMRVLIYHTCRGKGGFIRPLTVGHSNSKHPCGRSLAGEVNCMLQKRAPFKTYRFFYCTGKAVNA